MILTTVGVSEYITGAEYSHINLNIYLIYRIRCNPLCYSKL